jgi:hypothetical protein
MPKGRLFNWPNLANLETVRNLETHHREAYFIIVYTMVPIICSSRVEHTYTTHKGGNLPHGRTVATNNPTDVNSMLGSVI